MRRFGPPPGGINLTSLAARISYVGSPEHKDGPSFAGNPKPRSDATPCDQSLNGRLNDINQWLRRALQNGQFSELWDKERFPRYIWHREGDAVYEARLVNAGNGEYKGYQLQPDEWPEDFQ